MDTPLDIQNAMSLVRNAPLNKPQTGTSPEAMKKAAKEFESVFVSQFLGSMFDGIQTDGMFGGGQGEQMFRSMMLDQYGQKISDQGGFGVADAITRSLTQHQDAQTLARAAATAKPDGKTEPAKAVMFPTQKPQSALNTQPTTAAMIALPAKQPPAFAAHPATLLAASMAASASQPAKNIAPKSIMQ